MSPSYLVPGLILSEDQPNNPIAAVRDLQHDLRAAGYLKAGIDGVFGPQTTQAIRCLQYDFLYNDGRGTDGNAPISMKAFNALRPPDVRIRSIQNDFDQTLGSLLSAFLAAAWGKIPSSANPAADNAAALSTIKSASSLSVPEPFVAAVAEQESGGQHYHVPQGPDTDTFVVVGLDHKISSNPDWITSRGYGLGQFTLFHHPPTESEVRQNIADPVGNVFRLCTDLLEKFNSFVVGPSDVASDRAAEHPRLPLRVCRYAPTDKRYLRDCRNCAAEVPKRNILDGTPAYLGASISYRPTRNYASACYPGTPDRAYFLCDWPYAARRYNGGGVDSFHYQARILTNLLR